MRDNQKQQKEWLPLGSALFALGFPYWEIGEMVGISETIVRKELSLRGCRKESEKCASRKSEIFPVVFKHYAELVTGTRPHEFLVISQTERLLEMLKKWLREEEIIAFLRGVRMTLCHLHVPSYPPDKQAYALLMHALFGTSVDARKVFTSAYEIGCEARWQMYLHGIASNAISLPVSHGEIYETLTKWWLAEHRTHTMPIWTDEVFLAIDHTLDALPGPREKDIIRRRFGFGYEQPMTHKEIAEKFTVCKERVRQIEAKALRQLRSPAYGLQRFIEPIGDALARRLERDAREIELHCATEVIALRKQALADVQSEVGLGIIPLEILIKLVAEFALSVRPSNCLAAAHIRYVGELVQKTEAEMLKTKNFGRNSLKEIREVVLDGFGLRFGLRFSEALREQFAKAKAAADQRSKFSPA